MLLIARKNLFHDWPKLAMALLGITVAVMMMVFFMAMYQGFIQDSVNVLDHTEGELWILPKKQKTLLDPSGFVPDALLSEVQAQPGVARAVGLVMGMTSVYRPDSFDHVAANVLAFDPQAVSGLPWSLVWGEAEALRQPKTLIIDRTAERFLGALHMGQLVEIGEQEWQVVGVSSNATNISVPYVFMSLESARALFQMGPVNSIGVVKLLPGSSGQSAAARLTANADYTVLDRDTLRQNTTQSLTWETGMGPGLGMMALIAFLGGMVTVWVTIYTVTAEHIRDFATLKAIGGSNRDLLRIILSQSMIFAVAGFALGVLASKGPFWLWNYLGMSTQVTTVSFVLVLVMTFLMCLLAALFAARRVIRLDPMTVFQS